MKHKRYIWMLCIFLAGAGLIYFIKGPAVEYGIRRYIRNVYRTAVSMDKINVSWGKVVVSGMKLSRKGIRGDIKTVSAYFTLDYKSGLHVYKIFINNGDVSLEGDEFNGLLTINKYENSNRKINSDSRWMNINLHDINFNLAGKNYSVKGGISAEININPSYGWYIKDSFVDNLEVKYRDYTLGGISSLPEHPPFHGLKVSYVRVKGRKSSSLTVRYLFLPKGLFIDYLKGSLLGEDALMTGEIRIADRLCGNMRFRNVSLSKIIEVLGKDNDFMLEGRFNGFLKACFTAGTISAIEGNFISIGGGTIRVRKEADFEFLRRRMDERSYDTLIDNLRDYPYNIGVVRINKEGGIVEVELSFKSQTAGERNVTINFHNN